MRTAVMGNKSGLSRVTGCSKCHGSGRVGSGSKYHESGRVGSKYFQISRVRSDLAKSFSNLTGWVGSGQEFFKYHGSGQVGSKGDEKRTVWVRK